jgi:hypothetical protein
VFNVVVSNTSVTAGTFMQAQQLIANVNVGIGTATVQYPLDLYGNIHIANTASISGVVFSDGSFQNTAARNTPSYGNPYTLQFAGTANTFSGDSTNLVWDVANLALVTSNIRVLGNISVSNGISGTYASIGSFDQINSRGIANVQVLRSNGYVSGNTWVVDGNAYTSTSSIQQVVDSWPTASFRTAHYMLQITDTTTTAYQASQIMLLQDGTDVFLTEYADIYTATSLGSWSADISSGIVELLFTPNTSDSMNIKVVRTTIDI